MVYALAGAEDYELIRLPGWDIRNESKAKVKDT
jgi:hypothetical protein